MPEYNNKEFLRELNKNLSGCKRKMSGGELKLLLDIAEAEGFPIFPEKDRHDGSLRIVVPDTVEVPGAPETNGYVLTFWVNQMPQHYGLKDLVSTLKSRRNSELIEFYGLKDYNEFTRCLGSCSSTACPSCLKVTRNPQEDNACSYSSCPDNSNYVPPKKTAAKSN